MSTALWYVVVALFALMEYVAAVEVVARKVLRDVGKGSVVFVEMGMWDCLVCVWMMLAVLSLVAMFMARTKNTGKGKAASSSVERAVKKRKADASQPVKKSKGRRKNVSSESEEESEDEDIEEMFDETFLAAREKWSKSVAKRGFHCERGMKIETFIFDHPIRDIIQDQKLQFLCREVLGYLPSVVREFYSNLSENPNKEFLLETTVSGVHLPVDPESIALAMGYTRPSMSDRPYPFRPITKFDAEVFASAMCTNPVPMGGFIRKEFVPGKLKPEYALMNKIIHNMIVPKGKEKFPSEEEIQFLYEVMNGKLIDFGAVIWCIMRDFIKSTSEKSFIPYPALVTSLVEAAGIKGPSREKLVPPRLGPITSKTETKSRAVSAVSRAVQPPPATAGASSSSVPKSKSLSPLKRLELKIKGWFKCILSEQKQYNHRLSQLENEVHILRGEPSAVEGPLPNLEGDSDELDDFVDDDAFSSEEESEEE